MTEKSNFEMVEEHCALLEKQARELMNLANQENPNLRITVDGDPNQEDLDTLIRETDERTGWAIYPDDREIYFESDKEAREFFEQVCSGLSVRCSIGYPPAKDSEG